jgi:hypothetical protein
VDPSLTATIYFVVSEGETTGLFIVDVNPEGIEVQEYV